MAEVAILSIRAAITNSTPDDRQQAGEDHRQDQGRARVGEPRPSSICLIRSIVIAVPSVVQVDNVSERPAVLDQAPRVIQGERELQGPPEPGDLVEIASSVLIWRSPKDRRPAGIPQAGNLPRMQIVPLQNEIGIVLQARIPIRIDRGIQRCSASLQP